MKTFLRIALLTSASLTSVSVFADDKATCLGAASSGQTLRDSHQLIEARDQFRVCAQQQCPSVVQRDCAGWVDAVEKSIATVVITAKDGAGADLLDVQVSVDGAPLVSKLDGQAVAVNPGVKTFHFQLADGTGLDEQLLVKEGGRNQPVSVVLKRGKAATASTDKKEESALPTKDVSRAAESGTGSPWKTIGWIAGGAGVVGLGLGAAFGIAAIVDKNRADCVDDYCDAGPLSSAKQAAGIANVGLIAGGVLLAGGAALVLFAPSDRHEGVGVVQVMPLLGKNGGAISVEGSWQ